MKMFNDLLCFTIRLFIEKKSLYSYSKHLYAFINSER